MYHSFVIPYLIYCITYGKQCEQMEAIITSCHKNLTVATQIL